MAENLEFRLKVIEDNLTKALDQNEKKAKSLGSAIDVALGSFAASVAIKGLELIGDGFSSVSSFVRESVAAAAEAETAQKALQIALAATGKFTEEDTKSFAAFASEIQRTTAFEDDAVASSAALITQLARLDNEGLQRATRAATDLAATFNLDLETASRLVGKAAEGNTVALQKLGIQFEKGKNDAETFSNALGTLESRFGGNAAKQVQTYAGASAQLSNTFGDLKETIGGYLTSSPAVIAAFNTAKAVIEKLSAAISQAFGNTNNDFVYTFFKTTIDGAGVLVTALDIVGRTFTVVGETALAAIRVIALGIVTPVAGVLKLASSLPVIGDSFKGVADTMIAESERLSKGVQDNLKGIDNAINGDTFIGNTAQEIANASEQFDQFYNNIKSKAPEVNKAVSVGQQDQQPLSDIEKQIKEKNSAVLALDAQLNAERISQQKEFENLSIENQIAQQQAEIQRIYDFELAKRNVEFDLQREKAALLGDEGLRAAEIARIGKEQELANLQSANKKIIAEEKLLQQRKKNESIQYTKWENQTAAERVATTQSTLGQIATLQSSSNKTLFAVGRAAAISQATIDGYLAVQKTLASIPYPVNIAAAAAVGVSAAANVAKIAGVKGFAQGGVIGATSGPDNRIATVRDGEMILNASQQQSLFNAINSGSLGGSISIQIDGREIARAVRNQIQAGYKLA